MFERSAPDQMNGQHVDPSRLRAAFALGLSEMYTGEVPLYGTLLDTCSAMNALHSPGAIDSAARVGNERHGAIRLGSMAELTSMARLFALFGMSAVGIYDLRDATSASLPIVATAFRPIEPDALEASAFRMFTSVLVADDRRFFDDATSAEIQRRIARRQLFPDGLAELVMECESRGGVDPADADRLVGLAVDALRVDGTALDLDWHRRLAEVSPVAADIAGSPSTHLNHLTPRVFDIDATNERLAADGVEMIDTIQGPPAWPGPPVLLRQTSFRALDEARNAVDSSGAESVETVRVRFGEIEQRGVALTRSGRAVVDRLMNDGLPLESELPTELVDLARAGLVNVRFTGPDDLRVDAHDIWTSVESGAVGVEPVTYEDFLPASATGIFASNLAHAGTRSDDTDAVQDTALGDLVAAIGTILDPHDLAEQDQQRSLAALTAMQRS
jgi:uncharacterized glyoxalase superfamily metalloenzyme YdcJ